MNEVIHDLYGAEDQEAMYQYAISRPLEEKVQQAIMLIQTYEGQALQLSPEGYYVCFSGGKDSIVMERLFRMSGVKYQSHYNNVTIDPPELVQFLKKNYPQTVWHSQSKPLPLAMVDGANGPPTRLQRWCCESYKEQGGIGVFKAIGVRAEESPRRKGMWQSVTMHRTNHAPILSPILYWTETDVWQFIRENNMPYCSLYDEGFKRLGCVGCPMAGPTGQARDFARWPKYEALWKRGFQAYWDKYKGTLTKAGKDRALEKFLTVDDLWQWWISGKAYEGEKAGCQLWLWGGNEHGEK